jgi:hypothetical protein
MGRPKNDEPGKKVEPTLPADAYACLDLLAKMRRFGDTPSAVARYLIRMKANAPKKPAATRKRKSSDKEQYERFRQAARELVTDESEEAFERAFRAVVKSRSPQKP